MTSANRARNTILLGAGALLVLAAVLWFFVLSPRLAQASEIDAQAQQVATANLSLQTQYNDRLAKVSNAPQAAEDAVALFTQMPQEAELPEVLNQITKAASDAGLGAGGLTSLRTSVPEPTTPTAGGADGQAAGIELATMPVEIIATGTRPQLLAFLDNVQSLDRAVLVDGTTYARAVEGNQDTLTISGSMFVLRSELPDLVAQVEELLAAAEEPPVEAPAPESSSPDAPASASATPSG